MIENQGNPQRAAKRVATGDVRAPAARNGSSANGRASHAHLDVAIIRRKMIRDTERFLSRALCATGDD